jgi:hypothetical protein
MGTTALSNQILALITGTPGINTLDIARQVLARKSDVLVELEALRREQLVDFEKGPRGSKRWTALERHRRAL